MIKVNPYKPMSIVQPGMFVGRFNEIDRLETAVWQTRSGNPVNFMIVGERGIGKSSLLLVAQALAQGVGEVGGLKTNFLVIYTDIDETTDSLGLMQKIELGLRHGLAETDKGRNLLGDSWKFVQRLEIGGISIRPEERQQQTDEILLEEFAYSLADTVNRICGNPAVANRDSVPQKYDGVLILVDEADRASKELRLGVWLKTMIERLQRHACNRLMFGLAGLPELRAVLAESHPSSLRLLIELELNRLTESECKEVIARGLDEAKKLNGREITISSAAVEYLASQSEGFPHFVQQFCYSAFEVDTDFYIDEADAISGATGRNGAIESLGNRYYRRDFYDKIKKESYRQVLRIMADHHDSWVSKDVIRKQYKGTTTNLDNAIQALRERHIIVSKQGEKGVYRLQNRGFASWIKLYTTSQPELPTASDEEP